MKKERKKWFYLASSRFRAIIVEIKKGKVSGDIFTGSGVRIPPPARVMRMNVNAGSRLAQEWQGRR